MGDPRRKGGKKEKREKEPKKVTPRTKRPLHNSTRAQRQSPFLPSFLPIQGKIITRLEILAAGLLASRPGSVRAFSMVPLFHSLPFLRLVLSLLLLSFVPPVLPASPAPRALPQCPRSMAFPSAPYALTAIAALRRRAGAPFESRIHCAPVRNETENERAVPTAFTFSLSPRGSSEDGWL